MDERSLILNAIKNRKKNTPEVDFNFPEPDSIEKWAKRKKRQESFKGKPCEEWTNVDFLRYLDSMLKDFGVSRAVENVRRDSERINQLYDSLAKPLQTKMSNLVLKEYMDWWVSIWAPRLTGEELHLYHLNQGYQTSRFVKRYEEDTIEEVESKTQPITTISDDEIFDLGGVSLLTVKKGLVASHRALKKRMASNPQQEIQDVLRSLSKSMLVDVMNLTIQQSPYLWDDTVDFISLALPELQKHGLTQFSNLSSGKYFEE